MEQSTSGLAAVRDNRQETMVTQDLHADGSLSTRSLDWLVKTRASGMAQQRRGRVTAILIVSFASVLALGVIANFLTQGSRPERGAGFNGYVLLAALALLVPIFLLNRRGRIQLAGLLFALLVFSGITLIQFIRPMDQSIAVVIWIMAVVIGGLLGPWVSSLFLAVGGAGAFMASSLYNDPSFLEHASAAPYIVGLSMVFMSALTSVFAQTTNRALQESEELSRALVVQRQEIEHQLVVRTRLLQATVAVARAIAGTRDLDKLLEDAVNLIRESFGYYHVQVFLVDETSGYAVLRQSTGELGSKLLAQGHRLPVGSLSVIGQATASGQVVVARDVDLDSVHRRNPLLPDTRSELALPLRVGNRVIGALDLQSTEPDVFAEEERPTLQALADQIALAIENARLFEQAEESLRELRELSRDVTQRSWADFLAELEQEDLRHVVGHETKALQVHRSRVVERVLSAGAVIIASGEDGSQAFIAAPLVVHNEVVGVIGIEPEENRDWSQADLQLLQGVAERTSLAIENARLHIQARRAAERERMINDIASRLQRAPSLALLLESAAKELAEALGTDNVYAELSIDRPLARKQKPVEDTQVEAVEAHASPSGDTPSGEITAPDQSGEAEAEEQ